jgi:uncharacterized protein (TIGR02646 family)
VRHVQKSGEPTTVTETRQASTTNLATPESARDAFNQIDKAQVRRQLASEQQWLCAFCMRRIDENDVTSGEHTMKVAHRTPISKDPPQALTWRNLLGSCDGGQRSAGLYCTCDLKQRSTALTIDPTDTTHIAKLSYVRRGTLRGLFLRSSDPDAEKDLETTLALNSGELPEQRQEAWKAFLNRFRREGPKHAYGRAAWQAFFQKWRGAGQKAPPFVGVIEKKIAEP